MNIDLKAFVVEQLTDESLRYSDEDDDIRSILRDVCARLGERLTFSVSGFGQVVWPVDVSTDLPILMEQLPSALNALAEGRPAQIDFYEQGLERSLTLSVEGDTCLVNCRSWSIWQPDPAQETLELRQLREMLANVLATFLRSMEVALPSVRLHPWILTWEEGEREHG